MTPEQIAAQILSDNGFINSDERWMPYETDWLENALATALREARNQALEEAANLLAEQRNGATGDKNLLMFTLAVLSNAEDKIRALKHKDGQP